MRILILLVCVALCAAAATGAEVSGVWFGVGQLDKEKYPIYLILRQDGKEISGSGGPDLTQQDLIQNGKIDGDRITLDVVPIDRTPLHFDLTLGGGVLKGTVQVTHKGELRTAAVTLKKQ